MKLKVIMKDRSYNYRPRPRHGHKYTTLISNTWATFEAQFIKKLRNTGWVVKMGCLYKKACISQDPQKNTSHGVRIIGVGLKLKKI